MSGDGLLSEWDFCSQTACQTSQLEFNKEMHAVYYYGNKKSFRNMAIHVISEGDWWEGCRFGGGGVFITMVIFSSANGAVMSGPCGLGTVAMAA